MKDDWLNLQGKVIVVTGEVRASAQKSCKALTNMVRRSLSRMFQGALKETRILYSAISPINARWKR